MPVHTAVNFHYVGMPALPHPGIYGLSAQEFRKAVEDLASRYTPLSLGQVLSALQGEGSLPSDGLLITFDDGLTCQYETALPILEKIGAEAVYFVAGRPAGEGKGLQVHKLHWARANLGDERILAIIDGLLGEGIVSDHPRQIDPETARVSNPYDSSSQAQLKYYLNYHLPDVTVETVLVRLFEELGCTERDFVSDFYMSHAMIRELAARGQVGSHAMTHRPLAALSPGDLEWEMRKSKGILEEIGGRPVRAVSYPHGTEDAVSREVGDSALRAGFEAGYTMEPARNESLEDSLLLARIDARDIAGITALPDRSLYRDGDGT